MTLRELSFAFHPLSFLDSQRTRPDKLAELCPFPRRKVLVWQPEALGQIFRSERYMRLDGSSTLEPLVGRHSLLFANGPRHVAYRKVIGSRLRGRELASQYETIRSVTESTVDLLRPGTVIDVPEWTRALTLRIISLIIFGRIDQPLLTRFTDWTHSALGGRQRALVYRHFRPPTGFPSPWRTFLSERDLLRQEILDAAKESDGTGLIGLLVSGQPPLGHLGEDELVDQVLSMLFAGHETTASATTSALYWIARDDRLLADIRDELAAGDATFPLLEAVCQETLRISPPAMVAGNRVLTREITVLGQRMAAGTRLTPCIYLAHSQPDSFPDPHRFDPTRFLGNRLSAHHYLPFGGGTRRCLGADLAMLEMRTILATLLRRWTLRHIGGTVAKFTTRGPALGFGPALPMVVQPTRGNG
ncbi:cytochrome P450 [Kibdelosporangium banguiense]|uniref:Cytochrome P450 n=1 Tax=Kibdelosporangium banguiense TaxID=1365924 RepID=A0ABS4TQI1_9PSEU|nr:cytochrome P450 [Kibdelosporangium banguiense]MBP2326669.1 cytochrome P450 [Kibdelosporangium banguiense]